MKSYCTNPNCDGEDIRLTIGGHLHMNTNTPKSDLEKKQQGLYCEFCAKHHPGRCEKSTPKTWQEEFDKEFIPMMVNFDADANAYRFPSTKLKAFISKVEQDAIRRTEERIAEKIAANLGLWKLASAELFLTNSGLSDQERNILVATAKGWNNARAEIVRQKIDLLASLNHPEEDKL